MYGNPTSNSSRGANGQDQNDYAQQRQLVTKELELMHQYCTSTYETLAMRPSGMHSASHVMPRLGLEHPFLLDALFAFTSLHIAYLTPSEALPRLVDASRYQSQALAYCRQQLPILSAAECQAMFHCSAALGMLHLAFRAVDPDLQASTRPTETAHQLAHLWRGSVYILKTSSDLLDADTYYSLFPPRGCGDHDPETLAPRIEEFLETLRRRAAHYGHSKPSTPRRDTSTMDLSPSVINAGDHEPGTEYIAAIDSLQDVFAVHRHEPNRVLAWLVLVGAPFMDALSRQEPLACGVVLLWSVAFGELDNKWWATGYRRQLVDELAPLISEIDSEFADLAAWVRSRT